MDEKVNEIKLFDNYPDIVTVPELMKMLKISKVLAYKLINSKKIKAIKIGKDYRITKESIIKLLT